MKKIGVILLLLVYATSSFGVSVSFQYCCGKLKSVDFAQPQENFCGSHASHQMGSKPCCDSKQIHFKIKTEQTAATVFQFSFPSYAVLNKQPLFYVFSSIEPKKEFPEVFAPPSFYKNLNHLYCHYRI
ncbi:MAG: hypothetical protein ABIN57_04440 [Chitinophagaceae bacterium]